jgi:hypothetical protein
MVSPLLFVKISGPWPPETQLVPIVTPPAALLLGTMEKSVCVVRRLMPEDVDRVLPIVSLWTGVVVSIRTLPEPSIRIFSVPAVDHAIVSAAGDHIPVFRSPVKVRAGVATRPAARASDVAEAAPRIGVTRVGDVANTSEPEPVSSVTAAARLAELGVPRKVATPVPRPDTPVLIGRPVALVRVADEGVPRAGVTSVGEVERTLLPLPVDVVTPVPPLATASVPATVMTPPVAADGVSPVVPKPIVVTPAAGGAPHEGAAPVFPIRTCPVAPTAVTATAPVPLP